MPILGLTGTDHLVDGEDGGSQMTYINHAARKTKACNAEFTIERSETGYRVRAIAVKDIAKDQKIRLRYG